ncbi:hypothetical protein Z043_118278 [Scleropages formosus]|uniref:Uncharacterized protein n=1 Tax=Scleropages formosus TaxID=113540 RepID=A0A0P7UND5_SCLFO|nr:hypothetical protein Z043_118278 [Scleropages formosus]
MVQLQFTKDTLPDSMSSDFQNLNKFSEQQFVGLTDILFRFLMEPKEVSLGGSDDGLHPRRGIRSPVFALGVDMST